MWRGETMLPYIRVEQGGRKRGSRTVRSQPVLEVIKFLLQQRRLNQVFSIQSNTFFVWGNGSSQRSDPRRGQQDLGMWDSIALAGQEIQKNRGVSLANLQRWGCKGEYHKNGMNLDLGRDKENRSEGRAWLNRCGLLQNLQGRTIQVGCVER